MSLCGCDHLPSEEWRPVVGYPDYEVSNYGRVKSKARVIVRGEGIKQSIAEKLLSIHHGTHPSVSIRKNNKIRIHILVLTAFMGPCPPGMWGLHKDDDSRHNHLPNLYWAPPAQNRHDQAKNTGYYAGINVPFRSGETERVKIRPLAKKEEK